MKLIRKHHEHIKKLPNAFHHGAFC